MIDQEPHPIEARLRQEFDETDVLPYFLDLCRQTLEDLSGEEMDGFERLRRALPDSPEDDEPFVCIIETAECEISLVFDATKDADCFFLQGDFGPLPDEGRQDILEHLLQVNDLLAGSLGMFSLTPENQHIRFTSKTPILEVTPSVLASRIRTIANLVRDRVSPDFSKLDEDHAAHVDDPGAWHPQASGSESPKQTNHGPISPTAA